MINRKLNKVNLQYVIRTYHTLIILNPSPKHDLHHEVCCWNQLRNRSRLPEYRNFFIIVRVCTGFVVFDQYTFIYFTVFLPIYCCKPFIPVNNIDHILKCLNNISIFWGHPNSLLLFKFQSSTHC